MDRLKEFIVTAKALKSFIIKDSDLMDFHDVVDILGKHHGSTLETFIFDNEGELWGDLGDQQRGSYLGSHFGKFAPDETVDHYTAIRIYTVDMSDMMYCGTDYIRGMHNKNYDRFMNYFKSVIPPSVEIMIYRYSDTSISNRDIKAISDAITELIKERLCPNLSTVYFDEVIALTGDPDLDSFSYNPRRLGHSLASRADPLEKMVAFAKEMDINVILTNGSTDRFVEELCNDLFDPKDS